MKHDGLIVWQKAMDSVTEIYKVTSSFPSSERFGLTSQIRRAAVSIPSNIAEGHGRKATGAYLHHLSIAHGSLMEVETQLQISARLELINADSLSDLTSRTNEIGKMLNGLSRSLSTKDE